MQEARCRMKAGALSTSAELSQNTIVPTTMKTTLTILCLLMLVTTASAAVTFETIVSREHPKFDVANAALSVGLDGMVYLNSGTYLLRVRPDGTRRADTNEVHYASNGIAANADGLIIQAQGHFAHTGAILDRNFHKLAGYTELNNDNYDAPQHVEAGPSGDFYVDDAHESRIVHVNAAGRAVSVITVPPYTPNPGWRTTDFRISEKAQRMAISGYARPITLTDLAGHAITNLPVNGPFDMDQDGNVYVIRARRSNVLTKFGPDGAKISETKLDLGPRQPADDQHWFQALRLAPGGLVLLKRNDPRELFQKYDLPTGAWKGTVASDTQRLALVVDQDVWTAGAPLPAEVQFEAGLHSDRPQWQLYARPVAAPGWRRLQLQNGALQVPADFAGLYVVKVTPELDPWQRGPAVEYQAGGLVEVRAPGSRGTVNILTPGNRVYFGRGEAIPVTALIRSAGETPTKLALSFCRENGTMLWQSTVAVQPASPAPITPPGGTPALPLFPAATWTITPAQTATLLPGNYQVTTTAPGLTAINQPVIIGPGMEPQPFSRLFHGDMGLYSRNDFHLTEMADRVAGVLQQTNQLGLNLVVEGLGRNFGPSIWDDRQFRQELAGWQKRLADDPQATAPQKLELDNALLQEMGAFSSAGVGEMPILVNNDGGLPMGTGFDARKPEQFAAEIEKDTNRLLPFPAFRGWDWAANWWLFNWAPAPADKPAWDAAMKQAEATGAYDPLLDRVAAQKLGATQDAIAHFTTTLKRLAPDKLSACAAPYRRVETYPPLDFQRLDEVDLHYQCEQFPASYYQAHEVDFYKRPGKRAWGHPEIYNESGNGDQMLASNFLLLMRGADGAGVQSGLPPVFGGSFGDERLSNQGGKTMLRSLTELLRRYGNWNTTLQAADPVAILADSRMLRNDTWGSWMGKHFGRMLEAYLLCLENHTPASFVFTEDLKPGTLQKYQAVLVVDQRYEFEPEVLAALQTAQKGGVKVLADQTCRPTLVQGFIPVEVAFTHLDDGAGGNFSDTAYKLTPERLALALPALQAKLGVAPLAKLDNPEIYLTERRQGAGRFLYVVNYVNPPLDYGQMWRVNLFSANRAPLVAPVGLSALAPGAAVYDMLAQRKVTPLNGTVQADLRTLPMRLYAILPAPISGVGLRGPSAATPGGQLPYGVWVRDPVGKAHNTSLPVRVRLLDAGNTILAERYGAAVGADGFTGSFNLPTGLTGAVRLEATELCSGQSASLTVRLQPGVAQPATNAVGRATLPDAQPVELNFGPHLRDVALATDGRTALFNTMNWDNNLYTVDLEQGKVQARSRIGQYFAFAPRAIEGGFAVQGFDVNTAEGYQLYLTNPQGVPERRFSLYGLPVRLPHRFVPYLVHDHLNQFAVPANGSWVATAGDLGLAAWDRNGTLRWHHDWWNEPGPGGAPSNRHAALLTALDNDSLLLAEGRRIQALNAQNGTARWTLQPVDSGEISALRISRDGKTVALAVTTQGGEVVILRDGKVVQTLSAAGLSEIALSPDGSLLAVTKGNLISLYGVADGLRWQSGGAGALVAPVFSNDGTRLAASSELGSLYVFDSAGKLLLERDLGTVASLCWLPGGDLLTGGWQGTVQRLSPEFKVRWTLHLEPAIADSRIPMTAADLTPTTRVSNWSNALPQPLPLESPLQKVFQVSLHTGLWSTGLTMNEAALHDGKADAPPQPWLAWSSVEGFAEMSPVNWLELETYNHQLRLEGITLVEDAAHPESWLRDASFDRWDFQSGRWVPVQALLSDSAVHSHRFTQPAEGSRFRILLPWGCVGNIRLGEIVLHGQDLGPSHPDVRAGKDVAVVFDDNVDDLKPAYEHGHNPGFHTKTAGDAFAGASYVTFDPNAAANKTEAPPYSRIPHWGFQIEQNPQPGQYRYLKLAVKALSPDTKTIFLKVGGPQGWMKAVTVANPGQQWQTVIVDLWPLAPGGKPFTLDSLSFGATGGPAAFDRILLGRTQGSLP